MNTAFEQMLDMAKECFDLRQEYVDACNQLEHEIEREQAGRTFANVPRTNAHISRTTYAAGRNREDVARRLALADSRFEAAFREAMLHALRHDERLRQAAQQG